MDDAPLPVINNENVAAVLNAAYNGPLPAQEEYAQAVGQSHKRLKLTEYLHQGQLVDTPLMGMEVARHAREVHHLVPVLAQGEQNDPLVPVPVQGAQNDGGDGIRELLTALTEQLTGMDRRMTGQLDGMDADLAGLGRRLDSMDANLAGLSHRVTSMHRVLTGEFRRLLTRELNDMNRHLTHQLTNLTTGQRQLVTRIDTMERQTAVNQRNANIRLMNQLATNSELPIRPLQHVDNQEPPDFPVTPNGLDSMPDDEVVRLLEFYGINGDDRFEQGARLALLKNFLGVPMP